MKETGYPSIDKTHLNGTTFMDRNPIIPNINIYTIIKLLSSKYLDKGAIDCHDLKANYRTLLNDSVKVSLALKELGTKKGDIVSIAMPNFYQALATFIACNRIGAIVTFLDCNAEVDEISNYLNLFESPIFINYDKSSEENEKIKKGTHVKYIITLNKENINSLDIDRNYTISQNDSFLDFNTLGSIAKFQKHAFEGFHSSKEDAVILFTSGSTGNPKAVLLNNQNVLAAEIYTKNTCRSGNITGDKTLVGVPFRYPYGLVTSALATLMWGKEAILAPFISKDTIGYYYSKEPNIIFGSPAMLDLTINNIPMDQDLSFVRHFISGGDFLTVTHAKRGNEFFSAHNAQDVKIGNGFGNAETVSICSTAVVQPLRQETAGKVLYGTSVIIVDPKTLEEKKYDEEGLICVSGKHVYKEYYGNKELTAETKFIKNHREYFKTGTLGKLDRDGYLTITGRESRFYIMSSLDKVYCDRVQNIICCFDCVKDCVVVEVPDKDQLYVNKAYIVLNEGYENISDIKEYLNHLFKTAVIDSTGKSMQLKSYEIPTYIEFVTELPRKRGTDKIDYQLLEKDALKEIENNKQKILIK